MIKIKIPFRTPTVNHLYGRSFKHNRSYLKPEAKKLRKEIEEIIFNLPISEDYSDKILSIEVEIHENWFTKKGKVKRVDISNREKFLIDSVFGALNLEDKYIFEHFMKKIQSEEEFAIIKIKTLSLKNDKKTL